MLLNYKHLFSAPGEERATHQTGYARANHNCIIAGIQRILFRGLNATIGRYHELRFVFGDNQRRAVSQSGEGIDKDILDG